MASAHAVFDLRNGCVGVSVEELEVANAVAREERAGHGAMESGVELGL